MKFKSKTLGKGSELVSTKKIKVGRWVLKRKIGTIESKINAKTLRER